jgi:hypothetical protein
MLVILRYFKNRDRKIMVQGQPRQKYDALPQKLTNVCHWDFMGIILNM